MKKNEKLIYKNIDKNFFDLDEEKKLSLVKLQFDKPSDIFDLSFVTKKPIVNDEFAERIEDSFLAVPRHYKLDFEIMYKDLEGYTEEELKDIFADNALLRTKKGQRFALARSKLAIWVLVIGILFAIGGIIIGVFWTEETVIRQIVSKVVEISSWVTIWEALHIFFIDNKAQRDAVHNYTKRFNSITFKKVD